jgi:hypothetical protein
MYLYHCLLMTWTSGMYVTSIHAMIVKEMRACPLFEVDSIVVKSFVEGHDILTCHLVDYH